MTEINKKALEQTAFNLCSLHGFASEFVAQQERFALAVIVEYLTAMQEAEFIEPVQAVVCAEVKTLRDEFAMSALLGFIGQCKTEEDYRYICRLAYQTADSMMEARK
jgi:hypothetical protein